MKHFKFLLSLLFLISSLTLAAEDESWKPGDIAKGKEKAATCVACHGNDGNSANPLWPNLCAQKDQYIFKQLLAFKKKKRTEEQPQLMTPMAAALQITDMRNLASYFSSVKCK